MKPDGSGKVLAKVAGKVYLVGAGPGAIDLITMRGAEILARAQVVIYDSLVNPGLLRLAPASAELIHAGKRGGAQKDLEQSEINAMLIEHARKGLAVVRLKGGDPFIFGRGGEEAEALAAAGVEFEVVPGITSAIAAPAFAGIPLTHREHGSFVAFVTGHEDERKGTQAVPWEDLARAAMARGTIVILMATARLRGITKRLMDAGLPPSTPAAAIQWGTVASQKTVASTLRRSPMRWSAPARRPRGGGGRAVRRPARASEVGGADAAFRAAHRRHARARASLDVRAGAARARRRGDRVSHHRDGRAGFLRDPRRIDREAHSFPGGRDPRQIV
jgi:uroporphyrinogen III methyltransferase/synthase